MRSFSYLFTSLNLQEVQVVQEALGILEGHKDPKNEKQKEFIFLNI